MFKLNNNNHHHHHHQQRSDLLRSSCTMLLAASVLILLLSLSPQFTTAQTSVFEWAQKLKVDKAIDGLDYIEAIRIDLNNNVIKPGDITLASKLRNLDLTRASWSSLDSEKQHTIILVDLGVNGTRTRNLFTAINIRGRNFLTGQQVVVYEPPSVPCSPSMKHRLALLAFTQGQTIDLVDIASISVGGPRHQDRRDTFNLKKIIDENQLTLVAANVFLAAGESNGICSASSSLYPNSFLTLFTSIMIVMVMLKQVHSSKQQQQQQQ